MPNLITATVIEVIKGPTKRWEKIITSRETWRDGQYIGKVEYPPYEREWYEVIAIIDTEAGKVEKTFECGSEKEAQEYVPGYSYYY